MIYLSVTYCTVELVKERSYTVAAKEALLIHVITELIIKNKKKI